MPIKVMAAPRDAQKLLQAGIEKHLAAGLVDADLARIDGLGTPHRVFHLGLDALVGGKPIARAARFVGWRAMLVDRKRSSIAAAELVAQRNRLRFACVARGGHVAGSDEGEAAAEAWSRQAKGNHELALLRVPGAYCVALWLRGIDGAGDAFVPLAPCPAGLRPNAPCDEAELRAALLPEAKKQLAAPSENQATGESTR